MAYFDKESGQIILTPSEKETFRECGVNASVGRTPVADRIIKWILGETNEQNKRNNRIKGDR